MIDATAAKRIIGVQVAVNTAIFVVFGDRA